MIERSLEIVDFYNTPINSLKLIRMMTRYGGYDTTPENSLSNIPIRYLVGVRS